MVRFVLGALIILFGIGSILLSSAPRLWAELQYADEFVPAANLRITSYKCTNWNLVMFNRCIVTVASGATHASRALTDWRFGRAPTGRIVLLQRRDDPSILTTDVSLRTLGNRLAMVGMAAIFGVLTFLVLGLKVTRGGGMRARIAPAR